MLKTVLTVVGVTLLALLAYGVFVEPRFLLDENRHEAEVPGLPDAWDGQTVALLADLQVGMWLDNTGMVEDAVEAAVRARPALALFAGDFVYRPDSATVREAVALLRPLVEAGVPTVAVLGNHDYSMMHRSSESAPGLARYLAQQLEAAGVVVLENEAVPVDRGGESLYVVGVGSEWAGRADPAAAMAGLPDGAARVWLMHNPVSYRDLPAGAAPLTLAAHTHGGQVRIPFTPSESWLHIARNREVIADGWAADTAGAAGNRAYVNRGIGFSVIPARVRCRPELTLFTLRQAGAAVPDRGPSA